MSRYTPAGWLPSSEGGFVRGRKLLRVVFAETPDKYVAITAYLTSDIKRYWRHKTSKIEYDAVHDLLSIEFLANVSIDDSLEVDGVIIDYAKNKRIGGMSTRVRIMAHTKKDDQKKTNNGDNVGYEAEL